MFLLRLVWPSLVSVMSNDVPPISTVMTFLRLEWRSDIKAGLRCGSRPRIDGVDRTVRHDLANGEAAIRLKIANRLLGAERPEIGIDRGHIFAHDRREISIHHSGRGAGILTDLRIKFAADGQDRLRHHLAHDLGRSLLMGRIQNRPDKGDGDRLYALFLEEFTCLSDILFLHRKYGRNRPTKHVPARLCANISVRA